MRVCQISDLQEGMALGKSLFSENGQLLLRAGYKIDTKILGRLKDTGRTAVYIFEEGTEDIIPEDIISEDVRARAASAFTDTQSKLAEAVSFRQDIPVDKLRTVIERGAEFRDVVDVERITTEVTSIVDEILDSSAHTLNQTLFKSRTGYNTEHATDTTLIALLIARRLLYSRRDLAELGTGAFLHDLGKLAMPSLLTKPESEYTEEEQFLIREHPVFGKELLARSSDRFFMAQTTILHHHERQDGLGYPLGLRGMNKKPYLNGTDATKYMFPFAEILAVANDYDNLISGRPGPALAPDQALITLLRGAGSAYNREVVSLLAEVISIFPTGSMVRVAECSQPFLAGSVGAVMKPNSDRPHQPIVVLLRNMRGVKVTPKTVDLAGERFARLELVH